MVDASDLKSVDCYSRASSSLATPTNYLLHNTMPKLSNIESEHSGKREGTKFGARTVRMMKRKRARQAAKHEEKSMSFRDNQITKGFA